MSIILKLNNVQYAMNRINSELKASGCPDASDMRFIKNAGFHETFKAIIDEMVNIQLNETRCEDTRFAPRSVKVPETAPTFVSEDQRIELADIPTLETALDYIYEQRYDRGRGNPRKRIRTDTTAQAQNTNAPYEICVQNTKLAQTHMFTPNRSTAPVSYDPFSDKDLYPVGWLSNEIAGQPERMVGVRFAIGGNIEYVPVFMADDFVPLSQKAYDRYEAGWTESKVLSWKKAQNAIIFDKSLGIAGEKTDLKLREYIFRNMSKTVRMKHGWLNAGDSIRNPWIGQMLESIPKHSTVLNTTGMPTHDLVALADQIKEVTSEFLHRPVLRFQEYLVTIYGGKEPTEQELRGVAYEYLGTIERLWNDFTKNIIHKKLNPSSEWEANHPAYFSKFGIVDKGNGKVGFKDGI